MFTKVSTKSSATGQVGFTIIEVIIAMAMLAVLMGLALPSFSSMIDRNRVEGAMNDFGFAIRAARSAAVSRAAPAYLCPSKSADSKTPSCDQDAEWEDGFLLYVKPQNTSSNVGFLTYDSDEDELLAQFSITDIVSERIAIQTVNATEFIGFSNQGTIIQPSVGQNPRLRVCGASISGVSGKAYLLSTSGGLSIVDVPKGDCEGDFS